MKIDSWMDAEDIAGFVCETLRKNGVDAVMTGGAAVALYSEHEFQATRLVFLAESSPKFIASVLGRFGFLRTEEGFFRHPDSDYQLGFEGSTMAIGGQPLKKWVQRNTRFGMLSLLDPTQCVMERLAAHSVDEAVIVARHCPVKLGMIQKWAASDGLAEEFDDFQSRLVSEEDLQSDLNWVAIHKLLD